MVLHLVLLVLLPAFAGLTWWQLGRALDGNGLSWAYTFEWPIFGGYAIFMWWKLLHDTDRDSRAEARAAGPDRLDPASSARIDEEQDDELASYNDYLAALHAGDPRRRR
jgi:hypothetical protein